ncbi:phosphatase PAP2 family protein [Mucilaginibacter sp.]|jgi:membrane-associated phospholipid phosphatase|uniref:phosphatase PAP2 family protein n=1 Tax=Mucilaginibacter sp. TaxID=1882438 RepID=UPI003564CE53
MKNRIMTFFHEMGWYFLPLALAWIVVGLLLIRRGDIQGFLWLNGLYNKLIDHPVLWMTELSGGYVIASFFVLINARSAPANTLFAILLIFICWYTTIAIKYNHFADWKSPSVVLKAQVTHVLENQQLQPELDFPSSHAAVVGCVFLYTGWLARRSKLLTGLTAVVGLLLCYSRIYVGWSYPGDVLFGNLIGVAIAVFLICWLLPKTQAWYESRSEWWQSMLISIMRTAAICTLLVNFKYFIL